MSVFTARSLLSSAFFSVALALAAQTPSEFKTIVPTVPEKGRTEHNARLVAADGGKGVVYYTVPALSNVQYLPDQYPVDGTLNAPLDIIMAQDEFEPASFVVYSPKEQKGVQLSVSDLKSAEGGIIKSADVDLKVIKVWYQNGNGWYNYFADLSRKLVPELLLNDENLVKVDTEKQENYLRVDYENGSRYIWISAPEQIDPDFKMHQEPVYDAKTIQPVKLEAGKFKQFFVTVKTGKDTKPGLYTGSLKVGSLLTIPVRVRVLDFALPAPKTYYDLTADFYTMLYCVPGGNQYLHLNGYDQELSDKKAFARLKNQVDHGVTSPLYMGLWDGYKGLDGVKRSIAMAKKAGMRLDPFFEAFGCHATGNMERYCQLQRNATIAKTELSAILGHSNLWPAGGEEPSYHGLVGARRDWKLVHDMGLPVMCNGGDRRNFSGYNDDFRVGGGFAQKDEADFMHRINGKIGNYAGPHTGPENPDYMRRQHGMNLYKKEYDMMYNYGFVDGNWNDFHTSTYRPFMLVYYTKDDMIDTLGWEGIREGIDDIRYSTLMMTLAQKAAASGITEHVYAGRKALQFMALLNETTADLPEMRLEIIRHILTLKSLPEVKK